MSDLQKRESEFFLLMSKCSNFSNFSPVYSLCCSGGVSSIVQVEILKLLEDEFQGSLPLQSFFDLYVGEG